MTMSMRALACGLFLLASPIAAAGAHEAAAIIYQISGETLQSAPGRSPEPLRLFDLLPAGAILELKPGSRLALAFVSGKRYEISGPAGATLGKGDLAARSGGVRSLPPAPPLPRLAPISEDDHPGLKAGAIRIRREEIEALSPRNGATTLASATVLRFQTASGAARCQVEIEDAGGTMIFRAVTEAAVNVPAGLLAPGASYHWTVKALDRPGPAIQGEADFVTLARETAEARERLQRWVRDAGVADDLRLLEAVDRGLGLEEESRHTSENAPCPFSAPGVVLEAVSPESAAFLAGLTPGDRLVSWCRTSGDGGGCAERGDLRSPFDWLDLQMEGVQRGGVVLEGTRGAANLHWKLLPTFQGVTVAPLLQGEPAEAYRAYRDREQAGDPVSAAKEIDRAAESAEGGHCTDAALWLRLQAAQLRARTRQWTEADVGFQSVLTKARALGAGPVEAHLQMSWAETLLSRGNAAQARQRLARALELEETRHPESLGVATVLIRLGNVAERQDDLDEADRLYRRASGLVLRAAPGGGAEAAVANNLAVIAGRRGDLAQAELYMARALAIRERLTPASDAIVPTLLTHGNLMYARGDLAGAEATFLRAKKILEQLKPESLDLAKTLHDLGEIAHHRGDDDAAESLYRRELALYEKVDPSGKQVRDTLIGLGEVALQRRQGTRAEEAWRRALAISEKLNPKGPDTAWCLGGLAETAKLQGRGAEAEKLLERALAIWQPINPEAVDAGSIHLKLGLLLFDQGQADAAEIQIRTAIRIQEKNRAVLPEGYQALARLQARRGRRQEAAASYLAAVEALENQETRLGGARESRWLYGSSLGDLYFEATEHQIVLGQPREAWKLLERGRARGFREMLAQRDLRFAREVPAELYAERHRLDAEYDQAQADLTKWAPEQDPDKLEALQGRLRDLRLEQTAVQERILRSSPRLASLTSPRTLDLAAVRAALDPGTVLLEYAVGPERTWLFVVQSASLAGPGLSVFPIAAGKQALREEVEGFRRLLERPGSDRSALQARARRLYALLVRPAEGEIRGARRLLVSPDGPLHTLPFAALMRGNRYLVEWKPIHSGLSATVYAELTRSRPNRRNPGEEPLVSFGDPVYPPIAGAVPADPEVREALRRGLTLTPLPFTRKEVEAIAALFPRGHEYLGREATEEKAKALGPETRLVHFACHGLLDERFPLNSALALTLPDPPVKGQDNGLLQAWEIFESVRLDADLVTLSACDTALGKEMGGEGLVGLTRAFQYAGARSVLASLWGVADDSTATFMKSFYGYLRGGKTKDEALRAAQIEQIRKKSGASHPFFWAGFELTGAWQ
ncbi:MAG TPA: CHAT domain-containing protein [Thermoanaerobaculia bacterium]